MPIDLSPEYGMWYAAVLMILMTVCLLTEWVRIELVIFGALLLFYLGGIISLPQAFQGFSNEGMLTIAFLFVVAGALENSGALRYLTPLLFGKKVTTLPRKLLRILFPLGLLSGFLNNTPIVAMFTPVIKAWTEKNGLSASKFLMPLSFAVILGGMCTLIGTSTNLIIHGLMLESGMRGLGFFEISKIGLPLAVAGILFVVVFANRLLPERRDPLDEIGDQVREFEIELKVSSEFKHAGKTLEAAGLRHLQGLFLFQIERHGEIQAPVPPDEKVLVGDRLFFTGLPKTILELHKTPGLELTKDTHFDLKHYDSAQVGVIECVVSAGSPLVGNSVRDSAFRSKYEAVIIAIHRHGERLQSKIGDIIFQGGDTLLLLAGKNFTRKWYHSRDFYLIAEAEGIASKPPWQAWLSVLVILSMITAATLEIMPLLAAAALGTLVLALSKAITVDEVQRMIDWRILSVIAMSFGIAKGVENSGLAAAVANSLVDFASGFGVFGVLAAVYAVTSIYTTFITNNAAAVLLFPISMSAAVNLQADPRVFAIAVLVAAAASFATPISYQTNLMVYGPGGYKFNDFIKLGLPLQIFIGILTLTLIHFFYPVF